MSQNPQPRMAWELRNLLEPGPVGLFITYVPLRVWPGSFSLESQGTCPRGF